MKILSLYDGMSCGMLAMQKAGIPVDRYVAYEIDKYAVKTSSHNFPMIEHRGDVFAADFTEFFGFDFLVGGSPCTYWSIAQKNNRETEASGMGWELFSQYVRAIHEAKPRFFVYENNKSMSKQIRASIDEAFGFEAICINSALVSAQNRQRLYWVGKRNEDGTYSKVHIEQPEDRGILLRDVLDGAASEPCNVTEDGKARTIRATCYKDGIRNMVGNTVDRKTCVAVPVKVGEVGKGGQGNRIYSVYGKSVAQTAQSGGLGPHTGLYAVPVPCGPQEAIVPFVERKLDVISDKYGYLPEMFNPYNCAEITDKAPTLTASCNRQTASSTVFVCENCGHTVPCEWDDSGRPVKAISAADGKTYDVYEVKDGLITIKGKQYPIKLADGFYIIRKLTVTECMRLQTVPEWYEWPVSNTQAYKMLGNGWTVDVIVHLLKATQEKPNERF